MDIEQFRELCLQELEATEDMPFDDTVLVFRLKGKIFGCIFLERPDMVVLKCDAVYAEELRAAFSCIEGAYHWNKKYWNQIALTGQVPDDIIKKLIHHAWLEVNKKLPKKNQVSYDCKT